eukprot:CAMPEP_0170068400 /NCGR_PEP_ID=MMETSP0019_2-20121128/7389_1 /TAXON_ID=98059 /ORGANISM="Dinobryon sp., Strain UTEXLB2267" /LENGTH=578 /DNA_ID=CAMNT_0010276035 /DNA_START=98 /DNA_END=1834 /DNA_ORIENTATION=+
MMNDVETENRISFNTTLVYPPNLSAPSETMDRPDTKRITRPKRRICQYGGYCLSNLDCMLGNKCSFRDQYYSQCIPDSSQYATNNCASNWGAKCDDYTVCCDPGAVCNNQQYRQCSQREFSSCLLPSNFSSSYFVVSENVTIYNESPTMEPTFKSAFQANLICQYGGFCTTDSDCVAGNRCQVQNVYYSQCVPDPTLYLPPSTNCVSNWGQQCDDTSICCDPGALCNGGSDPNNRFRQCSQATTACINPRGFTIPTSSPTSQIGGAGAIATAKPSRRPTRRPSCRPSSRPPPTAAAPISFSKAPNPPTYQPSLTLTDVSYHNYGVVMAPGTVNLYHIYFGRIDSAVSSLMDFFAANLAGSQIYSTMTAYYMVNQATGQRTYVSGNIAFKKSVIFSPKSQSVFADKDMVAAITSLLDSGMLPVDEMGIYTVIFQGDLNYPGWLTSWCGFHSFFRYKNTYLIKYAVVGDPTAGPIQRRGLCEAIEFNTANGIAGADSMVSVYFHEVAETVSDPYFTTWYFDDGCSWAGGGNEIGDACNFNFGVDVEQVNWNTVVGGKRFLVQKNWLPGGLQCVLARKSGL